MRNYRDTCRYQKISEHILREDRSSAQDEVVCGGIVRTAQDIDQERGSNLED